MRELRLQSLGGYGRGTLLGGASLQGDEIGRGQVAAVVDTTKTDIEVDL